eukprot:405499-Pleurochrysis_carterae.AAC.1
MLDSFAKGKVFMPPTRPPNAPFNAPAAISTEHVPENSVPPPRRELSDYEPVSVAELDAYVAAQGPATPTATTPAASPRSPSEILRKDMHTASVKAEEHLGVEHAIVPFPKDGHCQFHAIVACLIQSSQRFATTHLGLLRPEMLPKSSALQYRFRIARSLARNAHLKLGGNESRARVVTFAESMCNEFIAERVSYSIPESLLETRRKHVKMYLRRFQPFPKTLYNPKLKEMYEDMYNKMVAEQRLNNRQLACFDESTLADTWVTCTVCIEAYIATSTTTTRSRCPCWPTA